MSDKDTKAETAAWLLDDLDEGISDLRASIEIFVHLTRASHDSEVSAEAWHKLETDLAIRGERIEQLWSRAWDAHRAEIAALRTDHEAALAVVRAEKAAPGSVEMVRTAENLWLALRSVVEVANKYCVEAGYPPRECTRD